MTHKGSRKIKSKYAAFLVYPQLYITKGQSDLTCYKLLYTRLATILITCIIEIAKGTQSKKKGTKKRKHNDKCTYVIYQDEKGMVRKRSKEQLVFDSKSSTEFKY